MATNRALYFGEPVRYTGVAKPPDDVLNVKILSNDLESSMSMISKAADTGWNEEAKGITAKLLDCEVSAMPQPCATPPPWSRSVKVIVDEEGSRYYDDDSHEYYERVP